MTPFYGVLEKNIKILLLLDTGMYRKDFFDEHNLKGASSTPYFECLLAAELIEEEREPDLYFLTPEAYDILEKGQLLSYLLAHQKLSEEVKARLTVKEDEDLDPSMAATSFVDPNDPWQLLRNGLFVIAIVAFYLVILRPSVFQSNYDLDRDFLKNINFNVDSLLKQHRDSVARRDSLQLKDFVLDAKGEKIFKE